MKKVKFDPNQDISFAGSEEVLMRKAEHVIIYHQKQSKTASFIEAVFNTFIGLLVAFVAQAIIAWVYDIPVTYYHIGILTFWMTVISVLRTYVIRRIWNSQFWKRGRNGS